MAGGEGGAAAGCERDEEVLLNRIESLETHDRPVEPGYAVVLVQQGLPRSIPIDQCLAIFLALDELITPLQFLADQGGPFET